MQTPTTHLTVQTIDYHKLGFIVSHWSRRLGSLKEAIYNPKGLVNVTYDVVSECGRFIVQMMSPIFDARTVLDHAAIQSYLREKGIRSPALIANNYGEYFWKLEENIWRVLEYIPHENNTPRSRGAMEEAAGMLGRLHHALGDSHYTPQFQLPGYHDPHATLERLEAVMADCRYAGKREKAISLYEKIKKELPAYFLSSHLKPTLLHGDPKFDNFLFVGGRAIGVVDFDTLMLGHELLDVGDAFRSFCRRNQTEFDDSLFQSIWKRYRDAHDCGADEREALRSTMLITLDLAARYLTDSLEEKYFQLKCEKYTSLHEQNLVRARRYYTYFENIKHTRATH